jgi:hypothetical protein
MPKRAAFAVLTLAALFATFPALAAKTKGTTSLRDLQTAGVKSKDHKHQVYDLFFDAGGKSYACRTDSGKSVDATDFVVGSTLKYELDGNKGKLESMQGKKVECKVVRVEMSPSTSPAASPPR